MLSFQKKSKHYVAVAKKNKTHVRCENCNDYVCGTCSKPVCWKCLQKLSENYNVIFTKRNWYIMLISCWSDRLLNTTILFTNHFKSFFVFFFQIKVCLVWKLCLISFLGQLTTMGLLSIQKFCSIVCIVGAILLILFSSYFEVTSFLFSVSWKKLLRIYLT